MRKQICRFNGHLALVCMLTFSMLCMQQTRAQVVDADAGSTNQIAAVSAPIGVNEGVPGPEITPEPVFSNEAQRLAKAGWFAALKRKTVGFCLAGVQDALDAAGLRLPRMKAAADLAAPLAEDARFRELSVDKQDLAMLPPGAIIIWSKSEAHPYGHISITQGGGKESSDHIQIIKPGMTPSFRVFVPKG